MPEINRYLTLESPSFNDLLIVYNTNNSDARKLSLNTFIEFVKQSFVSPTASTTFSTPGTGFSLSIQNSSSGLQWVIIQPATTLASGTVIMPTADQTADGTEILITSTQQITSFSMGLNGASAIYGQPSVFAAGDFAKFRFYDATNSWYRVG